MDRLVDWAVRRFGYLPIAANISCLAASNSFLNDSTIDSFHASNSAFVIVTVSPPPDAAPAFAPFPVVAAAVAVIFIYEKK